VESLRGHGNREETYENRVPKNGLKLPTAVAGNVAQTEEAHDCIFRVPPFMIIDHDYDIDRRNNRE